MKNVKLTADERRWTQIFKTIDKSVFYLRLSAFICGSILLSLSSAMAQLNSGAQQNQNGQAGTFVIANARIVTVSGATIERGSVLIQNGKIAAVGANLNAPADAQTIDAAGLTVYPGMIDAATNMGLMEIPLGAPGSDDDGEVGEFNPNARAIVAVNPHVSHVNVTRNNGITTVLTYPKDGTVAGQSAIINLVGSTQNEMAINSAFSLIVNFPRVSTFGGVGGGFGQPIDFNEAIKTRDKRLDDLRKMLRDADAYGKSQDAFAADNRLPRPATDLKLAALIPYSRGAKPVIFIVNREIDIRNAVKFADEMRLKMIVLGGNEAWKAADLLKQKNIGVIVTGVWQLPPRDDDICGFARFD